MKPQNFLKNPQKAYLYKKKNRENTHINDQICLVFYFEFKKIEPYINKKNNLKD